MTKQKTGRPSTGPKETLTVRMNPELVQKLRDEAKEENRSVNAHVEWILKQRFKGTK